MSRRARPAGAVAKVGARIRPGPLRVYVLGESKSGTTTMAAVFRRFRSGHECGFKRMIPLAAEAEHGRAGAARVRYELHRRTVRYALEVDSAEFLSPFAAQIADVYPRARFVVLIRDCFSWMDSALEHWARDGWRMSRPPLTPWETLVQARFGAGHAAAPADRALVRRDLPPVGALMRGWSERNSRLLAEIPSDRLLVLRTEDIDRSGPRLARFCDVAPAELCTGIRANAAPSRQGVLADVPREHAIAEADRYCGAIMERYWGADWTGLADRVPAWRTPRSSPHESTGAHRLSGERLPEP